MRAIPDDEVRRPRPGTRLTLIEVSDLTGAAVTDIEDMVTAGHSFHRCAWKAHEPVGGDCSLRHDAARWRV